MTRKLSAQLAHTESPPLVFRLRYWFCRDSRAIDWRPWDRLTGNQRTRRIENVNWLRRRAWKRHERTLDRDTRASLREGTHASQSHSRADELLPVLHRFREQIGTPPWLDEIDFGWYHLDRIVFSVIINNTAAYAEAVAATPQFFEGVEVKVG